MSLTSSSEKDLVEAAKKVGVLQRDRLGKQGNAFEWFQRMEAILRSHSLYYVVNPDDKREKDKRTLLDIVAGSDKQKQAQLRLDFEGRGQGHGALGNFCSIGFVKQTPR